jgi:hypothetical protein
MTLFFIKRSSFGPFETRTFGSGFQMVRISNGRDRPKSTIRKPNQSGFRMYTVYCIWKRDKNVRFSIGYGSLLKFENWTGFFPAKLHHLIKKKLFYDSFHLFDGGQLKNWTNISSLRMVCYLSARFQVKWTLFEQGKFGIEPDKSGFRQSLKLLAENKGYNKIVLINPD